MRLGRNKLKTLEGAPLPGCFPSPHIEIEFLPLPKEYTCGITLQTHQGSSAPAQHCPKWPSPLAAASCSALGGQAVSQQRSQPAALAPLCQIQAHQTTSQTLCLSPKGQTPKMSNKDLARQVDSPAGEPIRIKSCRDRNHAEICVTAWAWESTGCVCAEQQSLLLHSLGPVRKASLLFFSKCCPVNYKQKGVKSQTGSLEIGPKYTPQWDTEKAKSSLWGPQYHS